MPLPCQTTANGEIWREDETLRPAMTMEKLAREDHFSALGGAMIPCVDGNDANNYEGGLMRAAGCLGDGERKIGAVEIAETHPSLSSYIFN